MVTVTFITPPMRERLVVEVTENSHVTLLTLMERYNLPKHCVCGEGKCGACAVKVAPMRKSARVVKLNETERRELLRAGKLTQEQSESFALKDIPPIWRLACQYEVSDEPVLVAF
jgi:ferredoxin